MRTLVNLLITIGLLFILNAVGWLTLSYNGAAIGLNHLTWSAFGGVILVAICLWVVGILVRVLYTMATCFTLGLMIFVLPFLGWATLKLTAHFMPGELALHGFWITVLCGFLLMAVKIHFPRNANER